MMLPENMLVPHLLLAGIWILWCVLHSVMITPRLTDFLHHRVGRHMAYYRFVYVVISIATLAPVLWYQWRIETVTWWQWHWPWTLAQYMGLLASGLIFLLAARRYDQRFFFGLRQIADHREDRNTEFSGFEASGILRRMRHPYYSAGILLLVFWGDFTAANLILKIVGIGYFIIGAFLEERKLVREFGEEYRHYQKAVPMFIPRLGAPPARREH